MNPAFSKYSGEADLHSSIGDQSHFQYASDEHIYEDQQSCDHNRSLPFGVHSYNRTLSVFPQFKHDSKKRGEASDSNQPLDQLEQMNKRS